MKPLVLATLASLSAMSITSSAFALSDARLNGQLMKLDPATRLEQTCDTEVMMRLNQDNRALSVDKVIAYAFGDTSTDDNSFTAPNAVFRSKRSWYHLTYNCRTGPKHLDAHQLEYKIGPIVPREKWRKHYLYD